MDEKLHLREPFGVDVEQLARNVLSCRAWQRIDEINAAEVRNRAEVPRRHAEDRIAEREIKELRIPSQVLVLEQVAQELVFSLQVFLLLALVPAGKPGELLFDRRFLPLEERT